MAGRRQRGYLMEVPLMLAALGVALALLLPRLPPFGQRVAIGLAVLPVLLGLYYMIVVPGWMPGQGRRLTPPWHWLAFILAALAVVAGAGLFVLS